MIQIDLNPKISNTCTDSICGTIQSNICLDIETSSHALKNHKNHLHNYSPQDLETSSHALKNSHILHAMWLLPRYSWYLRCTARFEPNLVWLCTKYSTCIEFTVLILWSSGNLHRTQLLTYLAIIWLTSQAHRTSLLTYLAIIKLTEHLTMPN